jgi:hypothetical protein
MSAQERWLSQVHRMGWWGKNQPTPCVIVKPDFPVICFPQVKSVAKWDAPKSERWIHISLSEKKRLEHCYGIGLDDIAARRHVWDCLSHAQMATSDIMCSSCGKKSTNQLEEGPPWIDSLVSDFSNWFVDICGRYIMIYLWLDGIISQLTTGGPFLCPKKIYP